MIWIRDATWDLLQCPVGGASKSVGAPVEDTTAATEDTAAADFVHHIVKPCGKTANFWAFHKLYNPTHHPDLQDVAHFMLCHTNISTKGRTTSGLNKHLQHRHCEEYESMNERGPSCMSAEKEWQPSVAAYFQGRPRIRVLQILIWSIFMQLPISLWPSCSLL